jgi:hypothetical protein
MAMVEQRDIYQRLLLEISIYGQPGYLKMIRIDSP